MIKIHGTIGSYEDSAGTLVRGVELIDIISQFETKKTGVPQEILVEINSPGGLVDVGYAISEYLNSLKRAGHTITTKINGLCASIATVPFLVGNKRQIVSGSRFLIHNPYLTNISGNSDELSAAADMVRESEKELANFYHDAIGLSKETLRMLMSEDKPITDQQAVDLKFATEILTEPLNIEIKNKIVAILKPSLIMEYKNIIAASKEAIANAAKATADLLKLSKKVKALEAETSDGKKITMDGEMVEGTPCSMDGNPCISMTMKLVDGTEIVTDDKGNISKVTPAEPAEMDFEQAKVNDILKDEKGALLVSQEIKLKNGSTLKTNDKGEVTEIVAVTSVDEVAALKAENAELKSTIESLTSAVTGLTEKVDLVAKMSTSNYVAPTRNTTFAKTKTNPNEISKDSIQASREKRNKK